MTIAGYVSKLNQIKKYLQKKMHFIKQTRYGILLPKWFLLSGKFLKFQAEGQEFEITKTICLNSERSEQCFVTENFLTCSRRFLRSNKLEQLEFKLENNIGIEKHAGKVGNGILLP